VPPVVERFESVGTAESSATDTTSLLNLGGLSTGAADEISLVVPLAINSILGLENRTVRYASELITASRTPTVADMLPD